MTAALIALILVILFLAFGFGALGFALGVFWTMLWYAVVGLVIGGLGRLFVSGRRDIGLTATALYGIAGALLGGVIANDWLDLGWFGQFLTADRRRRGAGRDHRAAHQPPAPSRAQSGSARIRLPCHPYPEACVRKRVAGSLAWKLGAGFGCVVVMIVLIVAVSWWSIARMTDTSAAIDQSLTPRLIAADDARTAAAAMRSSQTAYVLIGPDGRAEYVADRGVLDQAMLNLQLRERTPGDRRAYDAVAGRAAAHRPGRHQAVGGHQRRAHGPRPPKLLRVAERAGQRRADPAAQPLPALAADRGAAAWRSRSRSTAWTSAALVLGLGVLRDRAGRARRRAALAPDRAQRPGAAGGGERARRRRRRPAR